MSSISGNSRLAMHVQRFDGQVEKAVLGLRNSRHIKVMDSGQEGGYHGNAIAAVLQQYKNNNPGATVGYRHYIEDSDQRKGEANIDKFRDYTRMALNAVTQTDMVSVVDIVYTPYNEVFPYLETIRYGSGGFQGYVNVLCEMGDMIRGDGFKAAGGNWSVTTPHPIGCWDHISGCFDHLDYIVLHGYSKPTMIELTDELYPHIAAIKYLEAKGVKVPEFILGEFGVDHALYPPPGSEPHFAGWRHSMNDRQFAHQLVGANNFLAEYEELYAACLFGAGAKDRWKSYDYTDCPVVLDAINGSIDIDYGEGWRRVYGDLPESATRSATTKAPSRNWMIPEAHQLFEDWRGTDGNEWVANTESEAQAFLGHAVVLKQLWTDKLAKTINKYYPNPTLGDVTTRQKGRPDTTVRATGHAASRGGEMKDSMTLPDIVIPTAIMPVITVKSASQILGVKQNHLQAFLNIESNGEYNTPEGYPVCRFEVRQWSRRNIEGWREAHEYFDGEESWQGQDDLVLWDGKWQKIHQSQQFRREVISFASTFGDPDEAFDCSSWGAAQLMGWHHDALGYKSARDMAEAFVSPQKQMLGFIMYLAYSGAASKLRKGDIRGAIRIYNGNGQVDYYHRKFQQELVKLVKLG